MKPTPTPPPMAEQLVPDQIWDAIAPLLPAHPPQPKGGRPWISDRAVLGGLIYVLRSSTAWRLLPAKALGCGSRVTCWRRLRAWQQAGVWEQLHHRLLYWLGDDGQIDWVPRVGRQRGGAGQAWGALTGPNPVDRGKLGSRNSRGACH